MKGKAIFLILSLLLSLSFLSAQAKEAPNKGKKELRYYRIDTVKTISGHITAVKSERSFHKKEFTVLYIKEKKNGKIYRVEVAPQWFFDLDLVTGSRIEVQGSFSRTGGMNQIMTRSITFQGEQHQFRDSSGFPMWRGKNRGNKYRGRRNRRHGQGRDKGKGKGKGKGRGGPRGFR